MSDVPRWLTQPTSDAAVIQDLREQVAQLRIKEAKLQFMLSNMPKLCVHYEHHLTQLPDGRVDALLTIGRMHFLDRRPEVRRCTIDTESFDAALTKFMNDTKGIEP
jgi:hypothetical protein